MHVDFGHDFRGYFALHLVTKMETEISPELIIELGGAGVISCYRAVVEHGGTGAAAVAPCAGTSVASQSAIAERARKGPAA